jgi:prepilin-type N-terminal cleavage/methylation domain-containing protein
MNTKSKIARGQRGFTLLEMMFVILILSLVMGVVFTQINLVQKRYRTEEMKLDLTQESREFMDQIVRDLHSEGYPTPRMFNGTATNPVLASPAKNDSRVAAGLVKVAYDELWFEGDVDGDGTVDVIDYKLQTDANGNCPCKLSRSQVSKQNDLPLNQNHTSYSMELTDLVNSGGANGAASGVAKYAITGNMFVGGTTQTNDSVYSSYKAANVFTYFNAAGVEVSPTDISGTTISNVKSIRINLNVLARQGDLQTGARPVMSYSAAVRLPGL